MIDSVPMFTPEFVFNDAKIIFVIIKNVFYLKLYFYIFQPFLTKRKIFMSLIFQNLSVEKWL